jgi:hypothetical protein
LSRLENVQKYATLHQGASVGHWGWFTIALGTLLLTMVISGLFSFIEDDLQDTSWIPGFFRKHPFVIGFMLLHVPVSTVAACKASLQVHQAELVAQEHVKVRPKPRHAGEFGTFLM